MKSGDIIARFIGREEEAGFVEGEGVRSSFLSSYYYYCTSTKYRALNSTEIILPVLQYSDISGHRVQ